MLQGVDRVSPRKKFEAFARLLGQIPEQGLYDTQCGEWRSFCAQYARAETDGNNRFLLCEIDFPIAKTALWA